MSSDPKFIVVVPIATSWLIRPESEKYILRWLDDYVRNNYTLVGVADIVSSETTVYQWHSDAQGYAIQSPYHVLSDDLFTKTAIIRVTFGLAHKMFSPIFKNFLTQREYGLISFPVADSPVNNLPELNWAPWIEHQFKTKWAAQILKK